MGEDRAVEEREITGGAKLEFGEHQPDTVEDGIRRVLDIGPHAIYTTILLRPDMDETCEVELQGFDYPIHGNVSGACDVEATVLETNLRIRQQWVDESLNMRECSWRIPAVALAKYQVGKRHDYLTTRLDIIEFVSKAVIGFHIGGDKPFVEIIPATRETIAWSKCAGPGGRYLRGVASEVSQDAIGSWGQVGPVIDPPLRVGRIEKFWLSLKFPRGAPRIGGVLPFIFVIDGKRARGVC